MSYTVSRGARALAIVCLLGTTAACATVTRGAKTQFTVESTPPGAAVKTSTGDGCSATPCSFKMPRKNEFEVTVSKAGFKDSVTEVHPKLSKAGTAGLVGNVLIGGVIGVVVDGSTGAMNDLEPNPLEVTLTPNN